MDGGGAHDDGSGQSKQLLAARPLAFRETDALFGRAETAINLLGRCRPLNAAAASRAFLEGQARGASVALELRHAPPPDLGELRRELAASAQSLASDGELGALYAARAAELELEARLAERIGQPGFAELARRRHAVGGSLEWQAAAEQAQRFAAEAAAPPAPGHGSDDERDPDSLLSQLRREIGRGSLALRIQLQPGLSSRAACGEGVIFVRPGERLSAAEARRITLHELFGHALPRLRARSHPLGLLRVGSARSSDDEEGRALHIEASHGVLDATRRRELGLRHLTAMWVAEGASAHEVLARARHFGCDAPEALASYVRAARGGGLCRELEYLPAWARFTHATQTEPSVAAWLALGRVSLDAARVLLALGIAQSVAGSSPA